MGRLIAGTAAALAAVLCAGCLTVGEPASAEPGAGERAWAKCLACHSLAPKGDDRDGPTLHRIVGREVAGREGYRYSPAMRAYARRQPRWTREALDAFLADPQAAAPGNAMGFFGMRDPAERAALVDWLAVQQKAG